MRDIQEIIKQRFDHDAAKQILKEKYEAKMLFAAFGGLWRASPELMLITAQYTHDLVLLDEYTNPCKVVPQELFTLAQERWQEQMNAWYVEFEELQHKR